MKVHVVVCIKSVIITTPENSESRTPEACDLNPFDRPVLETALGLCEEHGGEVTALSMGPDSALDAIYEALAMGVSRGVLISDPGLCGSDTFVTSKVLVAGLTKLAPFDLVLFGTRTSDSDTGQVGPQTASILSLPLVTSAHSIEKQGSGLKVTRKVDGFQEVFELGLPGVLTVHPSSNQPREITLSGIEQAFEHRKVETWSLKDIGLTAKQVGETGSPTRVISMNRVVKERKCEIIEGTIEEQAEKLALTLTNKGLI
ncbi:MAG: electron transfer flavoprotein subunit beta/FixA family protein [Proteobacteria bacterium]|nr:electron transfer flavoprotein subunit beta/FixA family protein [Pseudomonadota bacterium]